MFFSFIILLSTSKLPVSGTRSPIKIEINVDFPDPVFPLIKETFPFSKDKFRLLKTFFSLS